MARFIKLTNAFGVHKGEPLSLNIDQISSVIPFNDNDPAVVYKYREHIGNAGTMVYVGDHLHFVEESYEKISAQIPH